jgi:hypothetical protein
MTPATISGSNTRLRTVGNFNDVGGNQSNTTTTDSNNQVMNNIMGNNMTNIGTLLAEGK